MYPPVNAGVALRLQRLYRKALWPRFGLHRTFIGMRGLPFETRGADITVEGFGRSGNTFAVTGLRLSQSRPLKILSHYHYPFAVAKSVSNGVPVCLVLRDPMQSIVSYCQYSDWPPRRFAEDWLDYHRLMLRYVDDICVVHFEDFTTDFNRLIAALNRRYDLGLATVPDMAAFTAHVFAEIESKQKHDEGAVDERTVHRPSQWRADRRSAIADRVGRECADLMDRIEPLYQLLYRHAKQ